MKTSKDRTAYFKEYWAKHRKVTVTLTLAEYRTLEARAAKFSLTPGHMLLAESRAYQAQEFVPSDEMNIRLDDIRMLLRNIANNVNQLARLSNRFKQLVSQKQILQTLQRLETEAVSLIHKPWSSVQPNHNRGDNDLEI